MPLFRDYLFNNMDGRERTARDRVASLSRLFSGGHMRSPVSRIHEAKALRSQTGDLATRRPAAALDSWGLGFNQRGSRLPALANNQERAASLLSSTTVQPW